MENKTWNLTVEEDPLTGDAILQFPPEILELTGWVEGDVLEWTQEEDGSWILSKRS